MPVAQDPYDLIIASGYDRQHIYILRGHQLRGAKQAAVGGYGYGSAPDELADGRVRLMMADAISGLSSCLYLTSMVLTFDEL